MIGTNPDGPDLGRAVRLLEAGGLVAFPTETSYGLAVDPFNQAALARLYAVKERESDKAILLLIRDRGDLFTLVSRIPPAFVPLMDRLWPGPLTLVFPASDRLPKKLVAADHSIGLRISSHPLARQLLAAFGGPLTATSANLSGLPAAAEAREVSRQLGKQLDYILDGGPSPGGPCSTIVGCRDGALHLIRPGVIPFATVLEIGNCSS